VTKGARHKIILNVEKLRDRSQQMKPLAKDLQEDGGTLKMVLVELRAIIQTPIRPHPGTGSGSGSGSGHANGSPPLAGTGAAADAAVEQIDDENLPAQITRVLGKGMNYL
jgi:hypothetical protein